MPGKFTQRLSWQTRSRLADLWPPEPGDLLQTLTPMRAAAVVHADPGGARRAAPMIWGFTTRGSGPRRPLHMHARGETVDTRPTFATAFRHRRGATFVQSFNEGREIPVVYTDGTPAGRTWTQQWVLRRKDGRPAIIAVVHDLFDAGRGPEREFVQITVPANAMIATITDRMPLMIEERDLPLWLGEVPASEEDIRNLIRTREFDPDLWEMSIEDPSKRPPRPRPPKEQAKGR